MDREVFINNSINEHFDELQKMGYKNIGVFLQGSQNYNLDIYTDDYKSDIDTKAILLPSLIDVCKNHSPISTTHVRDNNEHIDLKDVRLMFDNFKKQNINFVEIMFTKYRKIHPQYQQYFDELDTFKEELVYCNPCQTLRTLSGMSMEKYKALEHPYPATKDKIDKWGYDGKQLSHIIRLNDFIKRFLKNENFETLLIPSKEYLESIMKAKLNKYSLEEARKMAKEYDDDTKAIRENYLATNSNNYNPEPERKLEDLKVEILMNSFKEELLNQ